MPAFVPGQIADFGTTILESFLFQKTPDNKTHNFIGKKTKQDGLKPTIETKA